MTSKILVTGASGFVGGHLVKKLNSIGLHPISGIRCQSSGAHEFTIGDLSSPSHQLDLSNYSVVVHCAALVHIMSSSSSSMLATYRSINVAGSIWLAQEAARAGVKKFIYLSSIKVNGENTSAGQAFKADDLVAPQDSYAISKMEAEVELLRLGFSTSMEVVIIRPPLVYGPGVKGNFTSMSKMIARGFPIPLGAIHNLRSLIALDNLVDLIVRCIEHPAAANQIFLAADGQDISTSELLLKIAKAMNQPSRLIPVPSRVIQLGANILGKRAVAQRLLGSLQVDISKTRDLLGWEPPISVDEGLRRCFITGKD